VDRTQSWPHAFALMQVAPQSAQACESRNEFVISACRQHTDLQAQRCVDPSVDTATASCQRVYIYILDKLGAKTSILGVGY
jgi:hypothetical protein